MHRHIISHISCKVHISQVSHKLHATCTSRCQTILQNNRVVLWTPSANHKLSCCSTHNISLPSKSGVKESSSSTSILGRSVPSPTIDTSLVLSLSVRNKWQPLS